MTRARRAGTDAENKVRNYLQRRGYRWAKLLRQAVTPWLFVSDWGMRAHDSTLNAIIQRYAKKAAVRKRVTCHTFRHSVATHLLKGHADIRHIQVLLGHRSLQSTQRYTRVEISDLREVVRRAHPRGR